MTTRQNSRDLIKPGAIVGPIHSPESLRAARRLVAGVVDLLEVRVDHFADAPDTLLDAVGGLTLPLIVTVRHPAEGGKHDLGFARRRELYSQFLPVAAAIDVELRSVKALSGVLEAARAGGVQVIVSFHNFEATPTAAQLEKTVKGAVAAGADVVKIAAKAETGADLHRLLGLFVEKTSRPLSVMAMGRFGKVSRLLFAQAGSVLNYAYLGTANASGQWSARDFRRRLAEVAS